MNIRIFTTGGTFDKEYNELDGKLHFKDSSMSELLQRGRNRVAVGISRLMMLDSLDMLEDDREQIARACNRASENKIIITHGTDTMTETARVIADRVTDKVIVLTGAMVPYKLNSSDGLFNIGCALAFVQCLPPGVYIVMNGRYFTWNNVYKNKEAGEFSELS